MNKTNLTLARHNQRFASLLNNDTIMYLLSTYDLDTLKSACFTDQWHYHTCQSVAFWKYYFYHHGYPWVTENQLTTLSHWFTLVNAIHAIEHGQVIVFHIDPQHYNKLYDHSKINDIVDKLDSSVHWANVLLYRNKMIKQLYVISFKSTTRYQMNVNQQFVISYLQHLLTYFDYKIE